MRLFAAALLLALFCPSAHAQTFQTLCPGQTGAALQACLRAGFTPASVYPYDRARDTLFAYVDDGDRSQVTDVYAGRTIAIPPGADPTISACNGDGDNRATTCNGALNINTEHAYPQSKGAASGPGNSDMHHLFPARADVNSSRGNNLYGAFASTFASKYYRGTQTVACTSACPPAEAETYSAASVSIAGKAYFMPRASVRGDLARAVFYFYTVYRAQADAADPAFFDGMKRDLRAWHLADAVSADEQARSARVKQYQGNDNPFVLDTTLVNRAYFDASTPTDAEPLAEAGAGVAVQGPWPNPSRGASVVTVEGTSARLVAEVFDVLGRRILALHDGPLAGRTTLSVLLPEDTPAGVYLVRLSDGAHVETRRLYVVDR